MVLVSGFSVSAQSFDVANLRAGLGVFYASEIKSAGLGLNAAYTITEEWEAAVGFGHIFEKDYVSWNILDLDAHYIFHTDDKFNVYGIAGLSVLFWKVDIPSQTITQSFGGFTSSYTVPGSTDSGNEAGVNIGIGMNYHIADQFNLAPELRYTIRDGSYVRIGAAVQYLF